MPTLILSIINEALPILDKLVPDQATVIRNRKIAYEREYDAEIAKGSNMDDALVAEFDRELQYIGGLLSTALTAASGKN